VLRTARCERDSKRGAGLNTRAIAEYAVLAGAGAGDMALNVATQFAELERDAASTCFAPFRDFWTSVDDFWSLVDTCWQRRGPVE
jgi:hypothetical protein